MATVDTANPDQLAAWNGSTGDYWTEHEDRFDTAIRAYNARLFAAAAIEPHHRVVDIGCGTGWTTRDAARLAFEGVAVGVDLSARMLERAREHSAVERLANASFLHADAQVHPFPAGVFDVVFSRTGTMFFSDPVAAFANLRRATATTGRLAMLTWQAFADNEWIAAVHEALAVGRPVSAPPPDAPSPFSLADPERVRRILTDAGWSGVTLTEVRAPMLLGPSAGAAFAFMAEFAGWMIDDLDAGGRALAHRRLSETMEAHDTGLGVVFDSAAWIVQARAT